MAYNWRDDYNRNRDWDEGRERGDMGDRNPTGRDFMTNQNRYASYGEMERGRQEGDRSRERDWNREQYGYRGSERPSQMREDWRSRGEEDWRRGGEYSEPSRGFGERSFGERNIGERDREYGEGQPWNVGRWGGEENRGYQDWRNREDWRGREGYGRDYGRESSGSRDYTGQGWRGQYGTSQYGAGQQQGGRGIDWDRETWRGGGYPAEGERGGPYSSSDWRSRNRDYDWRPEYSRESGQDWRSRTESWSRDRDRERGQGEHERGGQGESIGEKIGRFFGIGPKGYHRSDERIRDDVSERLADHPEIDASNIEVQVSKGEVTLTGTVDNRRAKRLAEDLAEDCRGVKDVHNQIRVTMETFGGTGTTGMTGGTSENVTTGQTGAQPGVSEQTGNVGTRNRNRAA